MSINKHLQISFMPWAGLSKSVTLGPVTFWPYSKDAENKIIDPALRSYLDRYLCSYVDYTGESVDTVTICSHKNSDFRILNNLEFQVLRNCADALIFSIIAPQCRNAVCANNRSFGPPSADVFELVTQNFQLDNDYINVKAGSITSGGWKIGEITFSKPWTIGGNFGKPNNDLISAFNKCFSTDFQEELRQRLFRSLEWFRLAHTESEQISDLSKIVMMSTGFEILLKFPKNGKRKYFVEYLENIIASDEFNRGTRTTHKGKDFNLSLAGCWAWDFYELRSKIVHGDSVPLSELIFKDWLTHIIVSDLVFWESIKRELFKINCIGQNVYKCASKITKSTSAEEKDAITEMLTRWFLGFKDVHKALGWLPENI
jgi:hypothetical protein